MAIAGLPIESGFGCSGLGSVMYAKLEVKDEESLCLLFLERQDRSGLL